MNSSIAPPTSFLSLAPTTSSSFPSAPISTNTTASETVAPAEPVLGEAHDARARRSSSLSSDASALSAKRRFLKLGPVFFGVGDGKGMGDWSEEVVV